MLALSDDELIRLLRDDVPCGDLTTETLGIGRARGQVLFRARQPMIVCCVEDAARLFALAGATACNHVPRPLLAVAGGVRADNAAAYVAAGADLLVTSAPYSAPPRDIAVSFSPC